MDIGPHVADDVLEKYLLERLPEVELASVEEHLLVCPKCQTQAEETEEFILATQAALREAQRKPVGRALHAASGILHTWFAVPAFGALIAAVAAAVFLPGHTAGTNTPASEVHLYAMRGPETTAVHLPNGSGLILDMDATGLPVDGAYGVNVVDSHGARVWTGIPQPSGKRMRALVPIGLSSGRYWVRLTRRGKSVREYGLEID